MTAIRLTGFRGMVPRLAPRQLPDGGAQSAYNVTLLSGELRPMRKARKVWAPSAAEALQSFYRIAGSDDSIVSEPAPVAPWALLNFEAWPVVDDVAGHDIITTFIAAGEIVGTPTFGGSAGALRAKTSLNGNHATTLVPGYGISDTPLGGTGLTLEFFARRDGASDLGGSSGWIIAPAFYAATTDWNDDINFAFNITNRPGAPINSVPKIDIYLSSSALSSADSNLVNYTIPDSEWVHFAAVFDNLQLRIYAAGVLIHQMTLDNPLPVDLRFSTLSAGFFTYAGETAPKYLDSVRLIPQAMYTANFTPPTAPFSVSGGAASASAQTWFGWPQAGVNMEPAALEGEERLVYTGDGAPKITTKALGLPAQITGEPAAARSLGIPAPVTAPGVAHAGGTGAATTRYYVYTFVSDWNEESAPSPLSAQVVGKVDGTWAITAMDASPPNTGGITNATHAAGLVTVTTAAANHYLRAGDEFTITGVTGMTDLNGTWTIHSTPAANQFRVSLTTAQTYTANGTWTRLFPWGPCTKRLYRTAGNVADFQLVAEGISGAAYNDTLTDAQILGDSMLSDGWAPPDVTLTGLVALPGGVLAGFLPGTKTVCFSEPYQPHAWPTRYRMKALSNVVGLAAYDVNLVVATAGAPEVFSGAEPGLMSSIRHGKPLPCLSAASVCSVLDGAVYASRNGLVRVDLAGATLFTADLFSPEQWNALGPSTMAAVFDGQRLLVATTPREECFIFDFGGGGITSTTQTIDALRADMTTGEIYFASQQATYLFDPFDTAPLMLDWWSKEFVLAKPQNPGAARVEVDEAYSAEAEARFAVERAAVSAANQATMTGALGGRGGIGARALNVIEVNGSVLAALPDNSVTVSFSLYADGVLVFSKLIPDQRAFSLPAGYRAGSFSVRIQANTHVRAAVVGDTMKSLAEA